MALDEHLPIYKKAMNMTIYFEKIVRSFSRYKILRWNHSFL